jgi:hypothetical protein
MVEAPAIHIHPWDRLLRYMMGDVIAIETLLAWEAAMPFGCYVLLDVRS